MKWKWLAGGSIQIQSKFVPSHRFLELWEQDKDDPTIFHPKFNLCVHRKYEFKVLSCGKTQGRFACSSGATVTVDICNNCPLPKE